VEGTVCAADLNEVYGVVCFGGIRQTNIYLDGLMFIKGGPSSALSGAAMTRAGTTPAPRYLSSIVAVGLNRFMVFGGFGTGVTFDDIYDLNVDYNQDPPLGTWTRATNPGSPPANRGAMAFGGYPLGLGSVSQLLVVGMGWDGTVGTPGAQYYQPSTNTWYASTDTGVNPANVFGSASVVIPTQSTPGTNYEWILVNIGGGYGSLSSAVSLLYLPGTAGGLQCPTVGSTSGSTGSGATATTGVPTTTGGAIMLTTDSQIRDAGSSTGEAGVPVWIFIVAGLGACCLLVLAGAVAFLVQKRRKVSSSLSLEPVSPAGVTYDEFDAEKKTLDYSPISLGSSQQNEYSSPAMSPESHRTASMIDSGHAKEIDYSELQLKDELGSGSFGEVWSAEWRHSEVVVKTLLRADDEAQQAEFVNEITVMLDLPPHPNVVTIVGFCRSPQLTLVTELASGGSLRLLLDEQQLPLDQALQVLLHIARGMDHLSRQRVLHKDLSARNCLLKKPGSFEVAICDFGLSRASLDESHYSQSNFGPLRWMAPESIAKKKYSSASDGMCTSCVLNGRSLRR
jgi:Protein tyrosine and serine/threonine kinase